MLLASPPQAPFALLALGCQGLPVLCAFREPVVEMRPGAQPLSLSPIAYLTGMFLEHAKLMSESQYIFKYFLFSDLALNIVGGSFSKRLYNLT